MKTSIILFILLIVITPVFAQNPVIVWQKTIGGSEREDIKEIISTSDGGFIIGGESFSNISGDKTEDSKGGRDLWVVKIKETGDIQWQKTIGGSGEDGLGSILQTTDGGYLVVAYSDSDTSGDKTENSRGLTDFWILKLDISGNIEWQHTYGGDDFDRYPKACLTADGGYILAGQSFSHISGDKTDSLKGGTDIWVLKLNASGSIVWQKSLGGNGSEAIGSIVLANDGGYLISATSSSDISGDKSENSIGNSQDYWVVKLRPDGSVEWDKTLGGTGMDLGFVGIATADGGYLVGGGSYSPVSGNKTENSVGMMDYWLLKLDGSGIIVWDKTIGGNEDDNLQDLKELADGSFLVSGFSYSGISGDKTTPSNGFADCWFVKINSSGAIMRQQTIGGANYDYTADIVLTQDGGFVVAATSNSDNSGDKTEDSKGLNDFWVYKMAPSVLGFYDKKLNTSISIYPNPTHDNFTIDLGKHYTDVTVQISNVLGQVISIEKYASVKTIQQEITASAGIYFLRVSTAKEGASILKIIKQ